MTEPLDPPEAAQPPATPPSATPPDAAPPPTRPFASNSETPPPAATPLVSWEAPAPAAAPSAATVGAYPGGPPAFTVGALLSDSFGRFGAAVVRFVLVAGVASVLSWVGSFASMPTAGSNPFDPTPSGAGGLLSLLSVVAGIISSSVLFAIADSDASIPFRRVLRRGVDRAGWVFLTSIILGAGLIVLAVLGFILAALLGIISPLLAVIPVLALFLGFIYVTTRTMLALPAIVADGYDSIQALKLSWRITKRTGIWLRMFAASLLLGLLVAPAALGALFLVFPAMFGRGGGQPLLLLVPAVAFALFTPLPALVAYSAYRRLVVPHYPRWTTPPAAAPAPSVATISSAPPPPPPTAVPAMTATPVVDWSAPPAPPADALAAPPTAASPLADVSAPAAAPPAAAPLAEPPASAGPPAAVASTPALPSTPAAPPFSVPALGIAAKALLAFVLVFDVAGIAAIPYGVSQMQELFKNGFPGFPGGPGSPTVPGFPGENGEVFPGEVIFGVDADIDTCTIRFPLFIATASTEVEWIASLERSVTPQDEVFLRVTRDGRELDTTLQEPGAYDCLGSETGATDLVQGVYTYEVLVNGSVEATGSLFVQ